MSRPEWVWEFAGPGEAPVSPAFTSRFDAEEWLGENWRHLAARGIEIARVLRSGEPVGTPVALVGTGIPGAPGETGADGPTTGA